MNEDFEYEFVAPKTEKEPAAPMAPQASSPEEFQYEFTAPKTEQPVPPSSEINLAEPPKHREWSDVAGEAWRNIPSSAAGVAESMVQPIIHPIETAKSIGELGKGAYSKAAGYLGAEQDAEQKAKDEAAINAAADFYQRRYGTMEGFKEALATDPVGVLSDVSTIATGGGAAAARAPGMLGKVGEAAKIVGQTIEPVGVAAKAAGAVAPKVATAVGKATSVPLFFTTGEPFKSLDDAVKAGATQNAAFWHHLTGEGSGEDLVNRVQGAVSKIADQRSKDYVAGMKDIKASMDPLPYGKIDNAYMNQMGKAYHLGKVVNQEAANALGDVYQRIEQWKNQGPNPGAHNMEDFDKLKQALDEVHYKYSRDFGAKSPAASAVSEIRRSVFDTIKDKDPRYADAMEKYATTTKLLREVEKEVAGGKSASVGAKLRKILKAQDSSHKKQLITAISEMDPDIPYAIAGEELSKGLPQGLRGWASTLALSGGGLSALMQGNPLPLLGAAMSSPAMAGRLQYGIGRAGAIPSEIEQKIPAFARSSAYAAGEAKERTGRATGGKVGRKTTAETLIALANRARKKIQNDTKPILEEPDEIVVSALKIANKHI